ncbi:MAG: phospho-N-acetylmuramoyl-pentapeptide-transferase [bacterium]
MNLHIFDMISMILISFLLAASIAVPIINLLYRLNILRHIKVDFSTIIEKRKIKIGTPIMGGLIIIFPVILINHLTNFNIDTKIPLLIFFTATFLGGLDDLLNIFGKKRKRKSLSRIILLIKVHKNPLVRIKYLLLLPWYLYSNVINAFESNPGSGLFGSERLFIQIILGFLLGMWTYFRTGGELWIPFIGTINIGLWIIPFAEIALLGMTNAVNFSDGLDGLSSGMLLSAFLGFSIVAYLTGFFEISLLTSTVIGGLVAYLYFNIPPARVQMGDTGSFGLGALLAVVAFAINKPILLLIIGLPFVIEISSTIIQSLARRVLGRRIFKMAPLHHHLEMLGWSEEKVVMRFWILSSVCMIIGLWIAFF